MSLRGHAADGALIELVAFDGKHFTLVSEKAYAPGQPLLLTVELVPPCTLDLKSLGSRKRADERYQFRARAQTLAKATRERILAALNGG